MNNKIDHLMLAYIIELTINISILREKITEILEYFNKLFVEYSTFWSFLLN